MPELPEVETTRRGVAPYSEGSTVEEVIVRNPNLRWPVPQDLSETLRGLTIDSVSRRAKYLLFNTSQGQLMVHLGMSGSLRVLADNVAPKTHDHIDVCLVGGVRLRYNDPRRFGSCLWIPAGQGHPLLDHLGPEYA